VAFAVSVRDVPAITLYSDNFDTNSSANWIINQGASNNAATFAFDYSVVGIPAAPNSGGTTLGLKLEANKPGTTGSITGISVSPLGQSFFGDYVLRADVWMNFPGPFPAGGTGSTQITGMGVMTAGAATQHSAAGAAIDSIFFGATGDGQTTADYRVYSPAASSNGYQPASGVFAAGTSAGVQNASTSYYSQFSGTTAPAAQTSLYPTQTGTVSTGAPGMSWRDLRITKTGNTVRWHIDNLLIATVDTSSVTFGGNNFLLNQYDINSSQTTLALQPLLFGLFDNVRVDAGDNTPSSRSWSNPAGGAFATNSNWTDGIAPDADDTAIFDLGSASYTVTTNQDISISRMFVGADDVTLNLGSRSMHIFGDEDALRIAEASDDHGTLRLISGALASGSLRVAATSPGGSVGVLEISGPTAILEITAGVGENQVGGGGNDDGTLNITNGGTFLAPDRGLYLGRNGGSGKMTVAGTASYAQIDDLVVGLIGHGELTVEDQATVEVRTFRIANQDVNPSGDVLIRSGGLLESPSQIQVGNAGTAVLRIESGGVVRSEKGTSPTGTSGVVASTVTSQGSVVVTGSGSQWIQDGNLSVGSVGSGSLRIENQGYVECMDAQVARTPSATGEAIVDGASSLWKVQDRLIIGGAFTAIGGVATLAVSNTGKVTAGDVLHVWSGSQIDLTGGGLVEVGTVGSPASPNMIKVGSGGLLSGNGQILGNVLVDGGSFAPGASPGTFSIAGNVTQLAAGVLDLEIAGPASTQYDQLNVTGDLSLAGNVNIEFTDGYIPTAGSKFDLFTVGGVFDISNATIQYTNAPNNIALLETFSDGVFSVTAMPADGNVLYETTFDNLAVGMTENPSRNDQDGWTAVIHNGLAYGEIQNGVANDGKALHEYTDISNVGGEQSFDERDLVDRSVESLGSISIKLDFYASSSDLSLSNGYDCDFNVESTDGLGVPVTGFAIISDGSQAKSERGLKIQLDSFNGVDSNFIVEPTTTLGLEWDTWHSIELIADLEGNVWESITVNGTTESLTNFSLPMHQIGPGGTFARPQTIDRLVALITSVDNNGGESSDSVYFDNIKISVAPQTFGDFNKDSVVDAADYVMWRKNDGSPASYDIWRTNFGRSVGSTTGFGEGEDATVPEPSSQSLLIFLTIAAFHWGNARRLSLHPQGLKATSCNMTATLSPKCPQFKNG
jgi:T5SS/PEP-CTERM-associated repeat protein